MDSALRAKKMLHHAPRVFIGEGFQTRVAYGLREFAGYLREDHRNSVISPAERQRIGRGLLKIRLLNSAPDSLEGFERNGKRLFDPASRDSTR